MCFLVSTPCRSEVSAGEAVIAQLERDLAAAQAKLVQAEAKAAAAQEDAGEKEKIIKWATITASTPSTQLCSCILHSHTHVPQTSTSCHTAYLGAVAS
jgi:hypothetical protein